MALALDSPGLTDANIPIKILKCLNTNSSIQNYKGRTWILFNAENNASDLKIEIEHTDLENIAIVPYLVEQRI